MSQKDMPQSALKLAINCPHFKAGTGCCMDAAIGQPSVLEEAGQFLKPLGFIAIQLQQGSFVHWRTRAKLPIRGTASEPLIGLYQKGTHLVVPIPDCQMHHLAINKA